MDRIRAEDALSVQATIAFRSSRNLDFQENFHAPNTQCSAKAPAQHCAFGCSAATILPSVSPNFACRLYRLSCLSGGGDAGQQCTVGFIL